MIDLILLWNGLSFFLRELLKAVSIIGILSILGYFSIDAMHHTIKFIWFSQSAPFDIIMAIKIARFIGVLLVITVSYLVYFLLLHFFTVQLRKKYAKKIIETETLKQSYDNLYSDLIMRDYSEVKNKNELTIH